MISPTHPRTVQLADAVLERAAHVVPTGHGVEELSQVDG
jgi:hypothetical protein